jgi:hypothetical protein
MAVGASPQTSSSPYANERSELESELAGLKTERYSWWVAWGQLAQYLLPRRYRWLVTPNQMNRGSPINGTIMDSTGTIAARVLASGMMSGITSPTRPWFKLRIAGYGKDEINPVNIWLAECEKRMMHVFQESNFYNAAAVMYLDLGIFGTAPMIIYEDFENVIQCYNPCAGEYYAWNNERLYVGGLAREMTMTCRQIVKEFGLANCSQSIKNTYKTGGAGLSQEYKVIHFIKPNTGYVNSRFAWCEWYFEEGATGSDPEFLRKKGFFDAPFICPRWDTTGNDAYGRSVGMDALGDVKQLQQETKRKAQAIDKLANPPMVADVELKNQPASTLPGGVTYVSKKEGVGFSPAYQNFRPPVAEMMQDIGMIQQRIKEIFFNDLFLMISSLDTVRTATEIDARREEKLVMLGPVLERLQTEAQDPIIDRVFSIMSRGGLLSPPPPEIANAPIQVEYVSMLAAAQSAANTTGIERFLAQVGNIAGVHPEVLDIPNWDRMMTRYGMVLGNDPTDINTEDEIAAIRQAKLKAQQAAQMNQVADTSKGFADAAKNLSATDVGGGVNALQAMLGGGPAS